MSIATRTQLATLIRQHEQGFLNHSEFYHAVCNLLANQS
jgi:hypothetical protein